MSELIIANGDIPPNHLRSFGHVVGFEEPLILGAKRLELELPGIWTPLDLPPEKRGRDEGIVASNIHAAAQAARLAEYLEGRGFDADKDPVIVLTEKEDINGPRDYMKHEGFVGDTHFSQGDTVAYLSPVNPRYAQLRRVMYDFGKEPGHFVLPEGKAPIGKYWSYRGHDRHNYYPHAYNERDGRGTTRIKFGRSVVAETTITEKVPYSDAEVPKLVGRISTYQTARYTPELTPDQQAKLDDIRSRREEAMRESYDNDPSFHELYADDIGYRYDQEETELYWAVG